MSWFSSWTGGDTSSGSSGGTLAFAELATMARTTGTARGWPDAGEGLAGWLVSPDIARYDAGMYTSAETWGKLALTVQASFPEAVYPGVGKLVALMYNQGGINEAAQQRAFEGSVAGAVVETGKDVAEIADGAKKAVELFKSPVAWLAAGALLLGIAAARS